MAGSQRDHQSEQLVADSDFVGVVKIDLAASTVQIKTRNEPGHVYEFEVDPRHLVLYRVGRKALLPEQLGRKVD